MHGVRVQRYNYSRRNGWFLGLGCLGAGILGVVFLCTALYMFGLLTPLVLRVGGVERVGDTDEIFAQNTPVPTAVVQNPANPPRVAFDLGQFGQENITTDPRSYTVTTGFNEAGLNVATATFTEAGLVSLCNERSSVCSPSGEAGYRNARVDLRPGGAVVYVEVNAGLFWQRIGIVFGVDPMFTRLNIVGVDIDGSTYDPNTLPAYLPGDVRRSINTALDEVDRVVNQIVQDMAINTGGQIYRLQDIQVNDDLLTLVLR